jgi:hypothetical protein
MKTLYGASKADRLAARFIPTGARLVPGPAGGAVYTYETAGAPYAIAFVGTSARSVWHNRFKSDTQRAEAIAKFHAGLTQSADAKAARAKAKAEWTNPLKAGDILYTSWGYDQTNVEFYAVTRVSGRRTWVREIAAEYEETGFMSGRTWPAEPTTFTSNETMHTAQPSGSRGVSIKIGNSQTAWLHETGSKHSTSSYA